jgi:SAM-dependent methyltransferase
VSGLAATERFSNRVGDYARYRPDYPAALWASLLASAGLGADSVVADIGAGTGISCRPLLQAGCRVHAVEPNAAMRAVAAADLASFDRFATVEGRADATGLAAASVDLWLAAQAFHWFDGAAARSEALRILRGRRWAAIVWNLRRRGGTPFLDGYEALLLRHGTDYARVAERYAEPAALRLFFGGEHVQRFAFEHRQRLDLEALRGRLRSSSYTPAPSHPGHAAMMAELDALHAAHAQDGTVDFDYDSVLYLGEVR